MAGWAQGDPKEAPAAGQTEKTSGAEEMVVDLQTAISEALQYNKQLQNSVLDRARRALKACRRLTRR